MRTGFGVDQLRRDAHPATAFAHRAFEDVAHAEFAPDLFHLNRTALIGEGRVTGDDEQPTDAAERRDVDAVAMDVAVLDNDVARIDPDAEFDAPVFRRGGIPRPHPALHGNGAGDRLDDARKFDQEAVAGRLDDAALVLGDQRVDQLAAQGLEARQSAGLAAAHEPAVAGDIGSEDRRQPALDPLCAQTVLPMPPRQARRLGEAYTHSALPAQNRFFARPGVAFKVRTSDAHNPFVDRPAFRGVPRQ